MRLVQLFDLILSKNYCRVKSCIWTYQDNNVRYVTKPVTQELYDFDG